jgi:catalase
MEDKYLTTHQGGPSIDNQNSLAASERWPVVLQDMRLIERLGYFDRERTPERVVHAKGAGTHGYFQVYKSMAQYTCANFLQDPTKKTPVFVRFSLVVGARGSASRGHTCKAGGPGAASYGWDSKGITSIWLR